MAATYPEVRPAARLYGQARWIGPMKAFLRQAAAGAA